MCRRNRQAPAAVPLSARMSANRLLEMATSAYVTSYNNGRGLSDWSPTTSHGKAVIGPSSRSAAKSARALIDRSGETEPLPALDFVPWRFSDACRRSEWMVL